MKFQAVCASCKIEKECEWTCSVCEQAGLVRAFCSRRCMHVHRRDGRHRLEAEKASAQDGVVKPAKRQRVRAQVLIVRRGSSAAERQKARTRRDMPES
jgi:hypothetical protein